MGSWDGAQHSGRRAARPGTWGTPDRDRAGLAYLAQNSGLHAHPARISTPARIAAIAAAAVVAAAFASPLIGLNREQRRAEDREQLAIDAVKRYADVVRETPALRDDPELAKLRAKLLKEPLDFFRGLRDRLQADRETRPDSLTVWRRQASS